MRIKLLFFAGLVVLLGLTLAIGYAQEYGDDVCTGGTASASSEYGGYPASRAFDDVVAQEWLSNINDTDGWIQYDLGEGVSATVQKYRLCSQDHVNGPDRAPKDWQFQGSDNGSDWDVLDTRTNETDWGQAEWRAYTFSNTTAYRYYRVDVIAVNGGSYTSLAEIEMMEMIEPTDTPTPSETPFGTPYPTYTPFPEPDNYFIYEIDGQEVALKYEVTAGDFFTGMVGFMSLLVLVFLLVMTIWRRA